MRPPSIVVILSVTVAALAISDTGVSAGNGEGREPAIADSYPGRLAPGAVMPPYLASPPYVGPGGFITLPAETTGSGFRSLRGEAAPSEVPSRHNSSTDDE